MTFAAGDAHPYAIYAGRFRFTFPILDAGGSPVTGATSPDSERSIDMGTFADCTNEATEIATSSGSYYLDLTSTETTGSNVTVQVKTASAPTTVFSIPVLRLVSVRTGTAAAGAGSTITLDSGASTTDSAYVGMYIQCTNDTPSNVLGQTRKIITYVGSTKVATVNAAWGTNPSSATTFSILIPETVNSATVGLSLPSSATDLATAILDTDMTAHQTQGSLGQAIGDPGADTDTIWALVNTNLNATVSSRSTLSSSDIGTAVDTSITNALGAISSSVWSFAIGSTDTCSLIMKGLWAFLKGKVAGGGTPTPIYYSPDDGTTPVITGSGVTITGDRNTSTLA